MNTTQEARTPSVRDVLKQALDALDNCRPRPEAIDESPDGAAWAQYYAAKAALRFQLEQLTPSSQLPGLPLPAMRCAEHGELFDAVQMRQHAVRYAHAALAAAKAPALPGGWRCWADDRMAHLTRDGLSLTFARESHDTRERGAAEFIAAAAQAAPAAAPAAPQLPMQSGMNPACGGLPPQLAPGANLQRQWLSRQQEQHRSIGAAAPADTAAQGGA